MRTVVMAHGIRQVRAKSQMQPLADALDARSINTHFADYGYVLIPTTNSRAVRAIHNAVRHGDDLAAFSNGAWAAIQAAEQGLMIRHLYLISPALDKRTVFPQNIDKITVFFTPTDRATVLGKAWRKSTRLLPWRWRNPHGWGEMGTTGPKTLDSRVKIVRLPDESRHSWHKHDSAIELIADRIEYT